MRAGQAWTALQGTRPRSWGLNPYHLTSGSFHYSAKVRSFTVSFFLFFFIDLFSKSRTRRQFKYKSSLIALSWSAVMLECFTSRPSWPSVCLGRRGLTPHSHGLPICSVVCGFSCTSHVSTPTSGFQTHPHPHPHGRDHPQLVQLSSGLHKAS